MGFQAKDIKILWSKAAGRCSICRRELVAQASDSIPSGNILIGENCHIVGEKTSSPRGKSPLSTKDRDRYPNLILLCANHHTMIDQDPDNWPIEVLHQTKADHEIWVQTQLTDNTCSKADELYSDLINSATEGLMLENWDIVSDRAVNATLLKDFVSGVGLFGAKVFKANWPGERTDLEEKIRNLSTRAHAFTSHFMSLARPWGDKFIEDRTWKRQWRHDYDNYAERSDAWYKKHFLLLRNLVMALNEFADGVRGSINPEYFFFEGKFTIYDSLGTTNEMEQVYYLPEHYEEIDQEDVEIKETVIDFSE